MAQIDEVEAEKVGSGGGSSNTAEVSPDNSVLDGVLNTAGRIAKDTVKSVSDHAMATAMIMGKAALHTQFPDDFEYYMCSLELLDTHGQTNGLIHFVVMPNSITESKTPITSITKTNTGISTLFNSTFAPIDISMQGSFGRKIRLLSGFKELEKNTPFSGLSFNIGVDMNGYKTLVKSGYGLIKILKSMVEKSNKVDSEGKPFILIFRNYSFNTHYIVEVTQSAFSQSLENNMIWYYNLEMKALAPADALKAQEINADKNFHSMVATNAIVRGIGGILSDVYRATYGALNISSLQFLGF